ncbi:MAG: ParB N-terminal domain-containing protein, partial [Candidatus Eisenbacteria bacterium]
MTRKALGRGLGALIPGAPTPHEGTDLDDAANSSEAGAPPPWQAQSTTPEIHSAQASPSSAVPPDSVIELQLERIDPNPKQPRIEFDDEALGELAESIAAQGVLQPIL